MRKYIVKVLVAAIILVVLFYYIGVQDTLDSVYKMDIGSVIFVLIILTFQQFVAALRWHIILQWMGEDHTLGKITQFYMLGAIANSFLLTSIAGLSTRILLLSRSGTSLKRTVSSLVIEKMFSAGTLLTCFVVGLAVLIEIGVYIPNNTLALAAFLAMTMVVLVAIGWFTLAQFGRTVEIIFIVRSAIQRPGIAMVLMMLSMFIFAIGFYSKATIAFDLDIGISLVAFIAIQPGITLMSAMPLSAGGWGVREASMVFGLGLLGIEAQDALAISLTYGVLCILATFSAAGISSLIGMRSVKMDLK